MTLFEQFYDLLVTYLFGASLTIYPHLELIVTLIASLFTVSYALIPLAVVYWVIKRILI